MGNCYEILRNGQRYALVHLLFQAENTVRILNLYYHTASEEIFTVNRNPVYVENAF